jgi:DNA replication protein DnaC
MSNKYVLEVLKEYETLQEQAKSSQRQRQQEIYKKFPRIRQIDDEIASAGLDIASSIFKGIDIDSFINSKKQI